MGTPVAATARVLVVEDNPALLQIAQFSLGRAGFQVTVARDGYAAWQLFQQGATFDVLVTDHQMPRMSGLELCAAVRQMPAHGGLRIVMVTAKELELDLAGVRRDLAIDLFFGKPYSPRELVQAVEGLTAVESLSG